MSGSWAPRHPHAVITLTRAELATLLSAIPDDWHLFFEFLVHTGLRISEMVGLTWEHMELETNPHVKVREQFYRCQRRQLKSGSGRRDIPLAPRMTARLIKHREASYSGPAEPVFTSNVGTELIRGKVADRVLNPARALVGMPWVSFHTFRIPAPHSSSPTARTSNRSKPGSATPTLPSRCAPTSTCWKGASAPPTSSTTRSKSA
ncbi:MAG TPA: tyrosine-type recombinase/integrase, partial [Solirubrobacterales bacterium]|nr:tyrosine-type recombinase/integrase [Solirubrobacterales bacterium]